MVRYLNYSVEGMAGGRRLKLRECGLRSFSLFHWDFLYFCWPADLENREIWTSNGSNQNNMIEAKVCLYLVSRERIVLLQKVISFHALPRVNEFIKVRKKKDVDYFAYQITQVTHREGDHPELWAMVTSFKEGKSTVSFFEDGELDGISQNYADEGWAIRSSKANKTFKADGTSIWTEIALFQRGS
jgi:hypothetical protein